MIFERNKNPEKKKDELVEQLRMESIYFNIEDFLTETKKKLVSLYKMLKSYDYTFIDNICEKEHVPKLKSKCERIFLMHSDIDILNPQYIFLGL